MSKRLQVLLPEQEMVDIQRCARREHLTVGEWVRRALREARAQKPAGDPETKLKAIRQAAGFSFPTADIDQMLNEIESGYQA
jgi:hypothetical protein